MLPLAGVRLVSLAQNVPGPVAVARLVHQGATAVKVEPPNGDPFAVYSRAWYDQLHTRIPVTALDLKSPDGRAALDQLLGHADVFVTSQRPAALTRLDLSPDALARRHPHLRGVAIVGDTAAPDRAGHDVTYQAEAGLLGDRLPVTLLADLVGAEVVVSTVLLALREPPGTHRTVGLRDALVPLQAPLHYGLTTPGACFGGADPAYHVYRTRDGVVALAALEPHFRTRLYAALARPINAPLADVMARRSCDDWVAFAATHDVPISIVRRD